MRKLWIAILASILASLGYSSCHSQKKLSGPDDNAIESPSAKDDDKKDGKNDDKDDTKFDRRMICLYGVPDAMFKKME